MTQDANRGCLHARRGSQARVLGLKDQREWERWRAGNADPAVRSLPLRPDEVYALAVSPLRTRPPDTLVLSAWMLVGM